MVSETIRVQCTNPDDSRSVRPSHYNESLLPEAQRDRLEVVLVSPRNPLNIGAAARAMANFGFLASHRRRALRGPLARGAVRRRRTGSPPKRQRDGSHSPRPSRCTLVIGTGTLTHRKPEQPVVPLPALAPLVRSELERGGRVALVFGPEKHGLTRDDLSYCHLLVEIPTDPRQPSMNLGQAVAVCLYELATRIPQPTGPSRSAPNNPPRRTPRQKHSTGSLK